MSTDISSDGKPMTEDAVRVPYRGSRSARRGPTIRRRSRTWSTSWPSMRSWSSSRRPRPKTSAGTCSVPGPSPRRSMAEIDGEPVGFALGSRRSPPSAASPGSTWKTSTSGPSTGARGIGKALLANVARLARERGYGRLEWSVLNWNEPAIGFYRALGPGRWTTGRSTGSTTGRSTDWPRWPGRNASTRTTDLEPLPRMSRFVSTPHPADGRLRPRRAAPGRRIHQAEHQRESVPSVAPRHRGARSRPDRPPAALSRPAGHRVPPDGRGPARRRARHDPRGQRLGRPADDHHPRLRRARRPGRLSLAELPALFHADPASGRPRARRPVLATTGRSTRPTFACQG